MSKKSFSSLLFGSLTDIQIYGYRNNFPQYLKALFHWFLAFSFAFDQSDTMIPILYMYFSPSASVHSLLSLVFQDITGSFNPKSSLSIIRIFLYHFFDFLPRFLCPSSVLTLIWMLDNQVFEESLLFLIFFIFHFCLSAFPP